MKENALRMGFRVYAPDYVIRTRRRSSWKENALRIGFRVYAPDIFFRTRRRSSGGSTDKGSVSPSETASATFNNLVESVKKKLKTLPLKGSPSAE